MKTIIIDFEPDCFYSIKEELLNNCPQLNITGYASCDKEAHRLINEIRPSLIFMEVNMPNLNAFQILNQAPNSDFEIIFVSHSSAYAIEAIKYQASGYLLKPLKIEELLNAVKVAERRINIKSEDISLQDKPFVKQFSSFPEDMIGIPTMEGLDFIQAKEIIRCEGYQRCTRIITTSQSDILSSYHIGFFRKRLEAHHFYLTHKSHLINLEHIRKYLKEGSIKMADGVFVPVSKRRKGEFLKLMTLSR